MRKNPLNSNGLFKETGYHTQGPHLSMAAGVASTKAYTSQMVSITMMALALSEDSIAKRVKRDLVIDGLGQLSDTVREVEVRLVVARARKFGLF